MDFFVLLSELDREIWEEELAEFVPDRIFDAHTHIYDLRTEIAATVDPVAVYGSIWTDWPISTWAMLNEADRVMMPEECGLEQPPFMKLFENLEDVGFTASVQSFAVVV